LTDNAVQAAWSGEYRIEGDRLPAKDGLPGDAVQVAAPSRQANFAAIVREVDVQAASAACDHLSYVIRFANDGAEALACEFAKATLPDPLPTPLTTGG